MLEQIKGISEAKATKLLNEGNSQSLIQQDFSVDLSSYEIGSYGLHDCHRDARS